MDVMGRPWAVGALAVVLVVGIAIAVYVIRAPDTSAPAVTQAVSEPDPATKPSSPAGSETAAESPDTQAETVAGGSTEQPAPDPSAPTELQPLGTADATDRQPATDRPATDEPGSAAEPRATDEAADQSVAALPEPESVTEPGTPAENQDPTAADQAAKTSDPPSPSFPPPSFDIVRIERSGEAVIAGRSVPGSEVQIILNGQVLGRVTSDQQGQWVFLPPSPLASGNHELSLRSESASGVLTESDNIVVVVVPELRVAGTDQGAPSEPAQTVEGAPTEAANPVAETQAAETQAAETRAAEARAGTSSEASSQIAESAGAGSTDRSREAPADTTAGQGSDPAGPEVTEIATIPDPDSPPQDATASSDSARASAPAVEPSPGNGGSATAETGFSESEAGSDAKPVQTAEGPASTSEPESSQAAGEERAEAEPPSQPAQAAVTRDEPEPSSEAEAAPAVQQPQVAVTQDDPEPQDEAGAASQGPLAILLPRDGQGGAKILQDPAQTGVGDLQLVLRSVDYDADGNVTISGEATAGAKVIVYLDNEPIGQGVVGKAGLWRFTPRRPVSAGLHRLRVDQLDDGGDVVARVETPFSRAAILTHLPQEQFVVVQPGNSLWRIARSVYGEGPRYSVIYQSNQRQIREPDLIYPGQIFLIPKVN